MKKYLFIGGPVDGQWKPTDGQWEAVVRLPEQIQYSRDLTAMPEAACFYHYTLRHWVGGDKFVPVYVLKDLTDRDAMRLLLIGYKP